LSLRLGTTGAYAGRAASPASASTVGSPASASAALTVSSSRSAGPIPGRAPGLRGRRREWQRHGLVLLTDDALAAPREDEEGEQPGRDGKDGRDAEEDR